MSHPSPASPVDAEDAAWRGLDLLAPTPEHELLAATVREFVEREVEPQAAEHDRSETFNHALFRRAADLGLLGVTLPEEYGGAGLDATAAVIVYEALSSSDPGFALYRIGDAVSSRSLHAALLDAYRIAVAL